MGGVLIFSESKVFDARIQAMPWGDRLEAMGKWGPARAGGRHYDRWGNRPLLLRGATVQYVGRCQTRQRLMEALFEALGHVLDSIRASVAVPP